MATYAKLLKNSNGDNILPYTRDNYVYHGDSTTDTVYSQLNTINQNLTGYNFELAPTPGNYATNVQNYSKKIGAAKVIEVQFDVKADTYTGWEVFFWLETAPAMNTALSCIIGNTSYPCSATIDGKINICINGAITSGQIGCIGGVIV